MSKPFETFCHQMEEVPPTLEKFMQRAPRSERSRASWESFGMAYAGAFESLYEFAVAKDEVERLAMPLLFLCRHSIELSIKDALRVYLEYAGEPANLQGHSLLSLWNRLLRQFRDAEYHEDAWTRYCTEIITHLHNADATGEIFRYPFSNNGQSFDHVQADIEKLAVAHLHIGMICDGAIEMLEAIGDKR